MQRRAGRTAGRPVPEDPPAGSKVPSRVRLDSDTHRSGAPA